MQEYKLMPSCHSNTTPYEDILIYQHNNNNNNNNNLLLDAHASGVTLLWIMKS
jgi:hypothetical protein